MKKELKRIVKELNKLALDVSEIRIAADAEYQAERIKALSKRLKTASTQIHGGGTGDD